MTTNFANILLALALTFTYQLALAAKVAYIHGDVSEAGFTPASDAPTGSTSPYDQMLLEDTGDKGLSTFKVMVEAQGHTISQYYDQSLTLDSSFLNDKDVLVFGLHQKNWSAAEKSALRNWLNAGGGMLIYSDSASGGSFRIVGAQNPVGQAVVNNLIAGYGMQVTVDQADGTTAQTANASTSIPAINGLSLEGEGVSPIAVASGVSPVEVLIPYSRSVNKTQNISIPNPQFASLVLRPVRAGHIVVMFDRQPMWNDGPGSDINEQDNLEILRSIINFLAPRPATPVEPSNEHSNPQGRLSGAILLLLLDDAVKR